MLLPSAGVLWCPAVILSISDISCTRDLREEVTQGQAEPREVLGQAEGLGVPLAVPQPCPGRSPLLWATPHLEMPHLCVCVQVCDA